MPPSIKNLVVVHAYIPDPRNKAAPADLFQKIKTKEDNSLKAKRAGHYCAHSRLRDELSVKHALSCDSLEDYQSAAIRILAIEAKEKITQAHNKPTFSETLTIVTFARLALGPQGYNTLLGK